MQSLFLIINRMQACLMESDGWVHHTTSTDLVLFFSKLFWFFIKNISIHWSRQLKSLREEDVRLAWLTFLCQANRGGRQQQTEQGISAGSHPEVLALIAELPWSSDFASCCPFLRYFSLTPTNGGKDLHKGRSSIMAWSQEIALLSNAWFYIPHITFFLCVDLYNHYISRRCLIKSSTFYLNFSHFYFL